MKEINSEELIDQLSFCVIDLETTGGNHTKDKIIEIGMVKVRDRKIIGEKSFLINPKMNIPEFIQNLTRISQNDVKDAPVIEDVIEEVLEFIGEDIIVAHNTSFDVPFLNSVLKRLKKPTLENKIICTNVMTKHLIPEILNSNLNYMSRLFEINHAKAHRAHDDALATAELLIIYLNIFIEKGIKKINQLYYPRNKFELDRTHITKDNKQHVLKILKDLKTPTLLTLKGERGLILAVLPLENPCEEIDFTTEILNDLEWEIATIRLIKPLLEGIFQFNNHVSKYPEKTKTKIINYLKTRYKVNDDQDIKKLDKIDFLVTHHLITDQVIVYPFLSLNTNSKPIFKVPAQKKKLYQFLNNQISRFEGHNKGRRKHLIHPELVPLIEQFVTERSEQNKFLFLERKFIKDNKDYTLKQIEDFIKLDDSKILFPKSHL